MITNYQSLTYTELEEIQYEYQMLLIDARKNGYYKAASIYRNELERLSKAISRFEREGVLR